MTNNIFLLVHLFQIRKKPNNLVAVLSWHRTQCIYTNHSELFFLFQDELEAELEELEACELEEQLLQPATTAPAVSVQAPAPAERKPTRPVMSTSELDELTALQAEMAL